MRILIASSIDKDAIEQMSQKHDVVCAFNEKEVKLKPLIKNCDILIFRSDVKITADILSSANSLKLIIRAGSGLDNIDTECLKKLNIALQRIPEPGALAVSEMTFALMLSLARQVVRADRLLRQGRWAKHEIE
ncbi:MAG: hydroxyacid dehydrogenase, partial [Alphaproteobacteria bacterium]|nr:hydroxyacid dehydrogenase [Alphaproteobacteria bacterium]